MKLNFNTKKTMFVLAIALLCRWCMPDMLEAAGMSFLGSWRTGMAGNDDESDFSPRNFRQFYNASLNAPFTEKINFRSTMAYSNNWSKGSGATDERINPSAGMTVNNDLFNLALSGSFNKELGPGKDIESSSWSGGIRNYPLNELWPILSARVGQSFYEKGQSSNLGASVNWAGENISAFYDYSQTVAERKSNVRDATQDSDSHMGRFAYKDSYWNRISLGFDQMVSQNRVTMNFDRQSSLLPVLTTSSFSGVDDTPESGALPVNQGLIDGDRENSAVVIEMQQSVNIAVRTNYNRVDYLYVYTTGDDRLLAANTDDVSWDLYSSKDGFSWDLIKTDIKGLFNKSDYRFELSVGTVNAEYMKLVATGWMPALDLNITEVEAYGSVAGEALSNYEQVSRSYGSTLNFSVAGMYGVNVNGRFSWDLNTTEGARSENSSEKLSQSLGASWSQSQYFGISASYNSVATQADIANFVVPDEESRSYNVSLSSSPITNIALGSGYSYAQKYRDGVLQNISESASISVRAQLYPDLSSSVTLGFSKNRVEQTGENSEGAYYDFHLNSHIREGLDASFSTSYNFSNADRIVVDRENIYQGSDSSEWVSSSASSGQSAMQVNWRISRVMSFSVGGRAMYGGEDDTRYSGRLAASYQIFRTSKANSSINYSASVQDPGRTVHNLMLGFNWNISKYFTFATSGGCNIYDDGFSWNIFSQLTAKF